jgi:hypothetical protein
MDLTAIWENVGHYGIQCSLSRSFSLFPRNHELGTVAQILKVLGQRVLALN